jgi:tRNA dihydrouridine synthase A
MELWLVIFLFIIGIHVSSCHLLNGESKKQPKGSSVELPTPRPLQFHVAPMQGYTNFAMRHFFRQISPHPKLWTEMEKVPDLVQTDAAALARRFGAPGHKDIVLQLGGNDPAGIRRCIRHLSDRGYSFDEINLNCGCPSIESGGATLFGASLMKQPKLTRELIAAIGDSTAGSDTIVSLKCRTAVYDTVEDLQVGQEGRAEKDYLRLHEYIEQARQGGISHLVLHARPAILSGLSPTKNRQVPPIDYSCVEQVARDFSLDVTLNGGIAGYSQLEQFITPGNSASDVPILPSYMAGRWMLRRPLDLALVQDKFLAVTSSDDGSPPAVLVPPSKAAIDAVKDYSSYVMECVRSSSDSTPTLNDLLLPLFVVSEQLREDYDYEEDDDSNTNMHSSDVWLEFEAMEEMYDCICETVQWLQDFRGTKQTKFSPHAMEFNKLTSSFKSLVGTKVAGKWKRNRSEL